MNKKYLPLFIILSLAMFTFAAISPSVTQKDTAQSDFDQGVYISTFYNVSGYVQLNDTNTTGTYISRVFDASRLVQWNNISWYSLNVQNGSGDLTATMTSTNAPAPNRVWATRNYSNIDNSWDGWKAFDGIPEFLRGWYPYGSSRANVTYDFGAGNEKVVTNYTLNTGHTPQPTIYLPRSWTFEASNDNSTWAVLDSHSSDSTIALPNVTYNFTCSNTVAYRYYKYSITAVSSDYLLLREIQMMGPSTKLNYSVRSCDDALCSGEDWTALGNNNPTSPQNLAVANNQYFQYKIEFTTNTITFSPQLFNVTIDYSYIDTTPPNLTFVDPTPANNSFSLDSFLINATIADETFTNITLNWNGTLTTFISTDTELTDLTGGNWVFAFNQTGIIAGASYYYNLTVSDSEGHINSTENRVIIGNQVPSFAEINNTPSKIDDLDPDTEVVINANIYDLNSNFDTAIVQWKNTTAEYWNNVTMSNSTTKGDYTLVNATFTLPSYEENITYRIFANDSAGEGRFSNNYTMESYWDCTWTATTDLGQTAGWDENKAIGNITINNTGDIEYTKTTCDLAFRITYDLAEGRIYYDGDYLKPSNTYTISIGENTTVALNATFLSEVKQENAIITITESYSRSLNHSRNTTATIVSTQSGPYLYQVINSYPTEVYLTTGNFSLSGYLRNLMGSTTANINNTAYNVTFNWTLPDGITNASGDKIREFTNISDSLINYSKMNATFSNLASMTSGIKTIYLYAQGYNLSGSPIVHANNQTLLTASINVTFQCYSVSDGVYVTACGSLDGDYSTATETTTAATGGGGGGGGGGGNTGTQGETSSADFEFVRGKTSEITVPFTNANPNATMINLKFGLSGEIAKYIEVYPTSLDRLGPLQKVDLSLKITSPGFIQTGQQKVVLSITGSRNGVPYNERRTVVLQVNDISKEDANQIIIDSESLIAQFKSENFSDNSEINNLFSEMQKAIVDLNYDILQQDYDKMSKIINSAVNSKKIIENLKDLIKQMKEKGIDVSGSERIVNLAELSLSRNDFSEALMRAQEAQIAFALEIKGETANVMYYLKYKTQEVSFSALLIAVISFAGYKVNKIRVLKKKIKKLREEEKIIESLIKTVQKKTFGEKKMSMEEYQDSMEYYEKRMSQIIEGLIELEGKRVQTLRFMSNEKRFRTEREKIIGMIKEVQKKYLKEKKIETRMYEIRLESYNKRLGQIDESIATLEAKRDLKKEAKKNRKMLRGLNEK